MNKEQEWDRAQLQARNDRMDEQGRETVRYREALKNNKCPDCGHELRRYGTARGETNATMIKDTRVCDGCQKNFG